MEVKEQLSRMLRIQELANEIAGARKLIEDAPGRIEEIEQRFRERNAEYVALKDRLDALEQEQRERNTELTDLEEAKGKYTADLMQVKNQREYAAMLKEIDTVKARIAEHEEAILKAMEEGEALKPQIESFAAHIQEERQHVEKERAEVEAEVEKARARVARDLSERESIEAGLPSRLVDNLKRVEELRQGLFLVKLEDGACQACFVRVRPQAAQEIRQAVRIHHCSQCRRFLYDETTLRPPRQADAPGHPEGGAPGMEAVDGGAL